MKEICTVGIFFCTLIWSSFGKVGFDVDEDERDDVNDGGIAVDVLMGVVDPELKLALGDSSSLTRIFGDERVLFRCNPEPRRT